MKKILLIVIDGLGDEAIPQLGGKTPLEAAKTPNLDFLAKNGISGLVEPWTEKGKLPTSEDTHLALFGYSPKKANPGRGVLEVLGVGMKVLPSDVCLRGNFATIDPKTKKIVDRRAGRIEKTQRLIKAISGIEIKGVKFLIGKAISHRVAILMRGKNLSAKISDSDPKIINAKPLKIKALNQSKEAKFTARILNEFLEKAHLILKDHPLNKRKKLPANYLLVRGAGKYKKIKSFQEKYKLKSACIAGGTLYKGIGKYLGMDLIEVKGANALPNTNLRGKILTAKKALENYDFVFLHIKAADNLAEDGNFWGKKKFIERIDRNLKPILNLKNTLIVITADHSTCSLLKSHCKIDIPLLIYLANFFWKKLKRKSDKKEFSERTCQKGKLGKIPQLKLMSKILGIIKG